MGTAREWISEWSQRLELPADLLAGVPRLELIGTDLFRMEPHKGLLEYETTQISVASTVGRITVVGKELRIKQMNYAQITICGQIQGIWMGEIRHE